MAIVLRMNKGSALSFAEVDGNFTDINTRTVTLETNKSNWDTAYSWGDHNAQTYLNNTDIITNTPTTGQYLQWNGTKWIPAAVSATNFDGSPAASVTTSLINNWNTAFSWGDHSVAGYSTFNGNYSNLTNQPSIPSTLLNLSINDGTSGQVLTTNGSGTFSFTDKTPNQNLFSTIAVDGASNIVADADTDTLTFVAGNNITITTDSNSDSITIASSAATQNVFDKIAVTGTTGQSNVEADSTTDTLTLHAGANMTINTDPNSDTVTFASSGTTQNLFDKIAVTGTTGQSNVEADSTTDTLTLHAGANMTITTDVAGDSVTFASAPAFARTTAAGTTSSVANGAADNISVTVFKSYYLLKIQTSAAAWVTVYTDIASRSLDASRTETTDPLPGQGIIAEVITTGAQTIKITPGVFGFNNESTVTSSIPLKVVNKSGSTAAITVTMTVVQVEG